MTREERERLERGESVDEVLGNIETVQPYKNFVQENERLVDESFDQMIASFIDQKSDIFNNNEYGINTGFKNPDTIKSKSLDTIINLEKEVDNLLDNAKLIVNKMTGLDLDEAGEMLKDSPDDLYKVGAKALKGEPDKLNCFNDFLDEWGNANEPEAKGDGHILYSTIKSVSTDTHFMNRKLREEKEVDINTTINEESKKNDEAKKEAFKKYSDIEEKLERAEKERAELESRITELEAASDSIEEILSRPAKQEFSLEDRDFFRKLSDITMSISKEDDMDFYKKVASSLVNEKTSQGKQIDNMRDLSNPITQRLIDDRVALEHKLEEIRGLNANLKDEAREIKLLSKVSLGQVLKNIEGKNKKLNDLAKKETGTLDLTTYKMIATYNFGIYKGLEALDALNDRASQLIDRVRDAVRESRGRSTFRSKMKENVTNLQNTRADRNSIFRESSIIANNKQKAITKFISKLGYDISAEDKQRMIKVLNELSRSDTDISDKLGLGRELSPKEQKMVDFILGAQEQINHNTQDLAIKIIAIENIQDNIRKNILEKLPNGIELEGLEKEAALEDVDKIIDIISSKHPRFNKQKMEEVEKIVLKYGEPDRDDIKDILSSLSSLTKEDMIRPKSQNMEH